MFKHHYDMTDDYNKSNYNDFIDMRQRLKYNDTTYKLQDRFKRIKYYLLCINLTKI